MSFVGKILVVIQVVLSVVFMAFAGAVYTAHMNWRDTANKLKGDLTKAENEKTTLRGQMDTLNNTLTAKLTTAEQLASEREAKVKGLQQEVNRLQTDTGDLQIARKTAIDQAKIATEESQARKLESLGLRKQNHELTGKRDSEFAERVKLEDTIRTLQIELETATGKNKDLLGKVAVLQQALEAAGLSSDVTQLATKNSPPPPLREKSARFFPPNGKAPPNWWKFPWEATTA
ncbi:MAG: hypothetical protein ACKV0T_14320 [Planctomycetales bacterium]